MEFSTIIKPGYFIEISENESSFHELCGENHINGAECPNCNKPLLKLFTLDSRQLPISYDGKIHFLFCWTCNIAQEDFFYKHISDQKIEILKYGLGGQMDDFPYENYPISFDSKRAVLKEINDTEQDIIHKVNTAQAEEYEINQTKPDLIVPKHQIGGEPYLLNEYRTLACPQCSEDMKFIASFGDRTGSSGGFTNNEYVQTVYQICQNCRTLGAYQMTD